MGEKVKSISFWAVWLFCLCYFMMLFDFPNKLTIAIGSLICLGLLIMQKAFRINLGLCLLVVTIGSYFSIQYGLGKALTMGLPYVGILLYVFGNYLACEFKGGPHAERKFMPLLGALILGFSIHGYLNSYMFLAGFRTEAGRHWHDFWMHVPLPGTEQVIYFLPVLSCIFPALIFFKKRPAINVMVLISSLFFIYMSWISNSRMSIFIFPLVFAAQVVLYVILEWKKVKELYLQNKKWFLGIFAAMVVLLLLLLFTDNPIMAALNAKLGRDGGIFGSLRFVAQRRALEQLFLYPFGGRQMDFGEINYAHNLWLDLANTAGLIPFFALTAYTVLTAYELIRWLMKKDIPTDRKLILAGIYGAFFLYYSVERGIEGSMHFMTPWFFINGMVHGELSSLKKLNK